MKIKKDDTILVIKGKYQGKKGKVLRAMPKKNRAIVEGINIIKRHTRARKTGEKGKILAAPGPINISNIKLICKKCKKAVKVQYKIVLEKDKKVKKRICKKCGKET